MISVHEWRAPNEIVHASNVAGKHEKRYRACVLHIFHCSSDSLRVYATQARVIIVNEREWDALYEV